MTGVSASVAGIAFAVAVFLLWKGKAPKFTAVLVLLGSASISAGIFGRIQHSITQALTNISASLTAQFFAVAVPAFLAIFVVAWFVHDLWPSHKASRVTSGVALLVPPLAAAIPGAAGALIVSMLGLLVTVTGDLIQAIAGG